MKPIRNLQDCEAECPVKLAADIMEGKWTTLVMRELLPKEKSYSEIQRALTSISPKVLTTRLRFLEQQHIITRKVFPTIPPTTEYKLTPLGKKLEVVLYAMAAFGEEIKQSYQEKIQASA